MKIKIERFCKYIEYEINFNHFKTCLFQGASGEGKTTLFEAIRFCLYGNNSNIYPSGNPSTSKKQTKVTLEIPEYSDLIISRCKPPEVLIVSVSGTKLESLAAQEYIDSIFGNFSMFISTTYLSQGQRHPLMSLTNKEKFDLLSLLTFGLNSEEHPDTFINTIEINIKELDKKLEKKILEREFNLQKLKCNFQETSDEEINTFQNKLTSLTSRIDKISEKWEKTLEKENKKSSLKSQLSNIVKKLETVERSAQLEILSEIQLKQLKEYLSLPKLEKSEKPLHYEKTFTLEETDKLISDLNRYNKILEKKNSLEIIPYSLSDLENMKKYTTLKEKLVSPKRLVDKNLLIYDLDVLLKAKKLLKLLPSIYYSLDPNSKDDFLEYFHSLKDKPKIWLEPEFDSQEYKNQINKLEEKSREDKICKNYKICKDKDKIYQSIEIVENHLNLQTEYIQYKKLEESLQHLNQKLIQKNDEILKLQTNYAHKLEKYDLTDLDNLKQRTGKGYICPECQTNLLLKENILIKCNSKAIPEDKAKKFEEYFKREFLLKSQITDITKEIEKIEKDKITLRTGPIYPNLSKIMKMVEDLKSLTFVEIEGDINDIKILYECAKFKEKYPLLKIPPSEVLEDPLNSKHLNLYPDIQKELNNFTLTFDETIEMISLHQDFNIQVEFDTLTQEMSNYTENNFSLSEIKSLEKKIIQQQTIQQMLDEELSKINIPKLSLEELTTYRQKTLLYEKYSKYKTLKRENQTLRQSLNFDFEGITLDKLKKFNKSLLIEWLNEQEQLMHKLNEIIIKDTSAQLKIKKLELENEKVKISNQIDEAKICLTIGKQNKYIKRYESKKMALEKIKILAFQARTQTLQQFVDNLNISINKILSELFEDEILVKLQLEKQNKSNDKVRSVVNFLIEYRGYQFDSPMSLSGGERDRLSLALMIALASVCGSKIVLLDECLSSLNEELRLVCIQTLNKYLPGKTVINVCHSVTQGFHDETVNIK